MTHFPMSTQFSRTIKAFTKQAEDRADKRKKVDSSFAHDEIPDTVYGQEQRETHATAWGKAHSKLVEGFMAMEPARLFSSVDPMMTPTKRKAKVDRELLSHTPAGKAVGLIPSEEGPDAVKRLKGMSNFWTALVRDPGNHEGAIYFRDLHEKTVGNCTSTEDMYTSNMCRFPIHNPLNAIWKRFFNCTNLWMKSYIETPLMEKFDTTCLHAVTVTKRDARFIYDPMQPGTGVHLTGLYVTAMRDPVNYAVFCIKNTGEHPLNTIEYGNPLEYLLTNIGEWILDKFGSELLAHPPWAWPTTVDAVDNKTCTVLLCVMLSLAGLLHHINRPVNVILGGALDEITWTQMLKHIDTIAHNSFGDNVYA